MSLRGYAICTEPRSGSNFLCQLLESTGVLGRPLEYLNGDSMRGYYWPDYPRDVEGQLAAVLDKGATPNDVYGLKLFTSQFPMVDWTSGLLGLRFIHLERRDVLGQAISLARADMTGAYRASRPARERDAHYNAAAIALRLRNIVVGHARWRLYFARNGITPLHLAYEDVAADPQHAVRRVAEVMAIPLTTAFSMAKVEVTIQRDALNDQWRERFVQDAGALGRLDGLDEGYLPRVAARVRSKLRRTVLKV